MIEIVALKAPATLQDGGRPGAMHMGVPPGGALVPELLARANAGAGNAKGTLAIEAFGALTIAARGGDVLVATDAGHARVLARDESWEVPAPLWRVGYVAVRGGFDAPVVLGGRGTLLGARLGGHEGCVLARRDRLAIGDASRVVSAESVSAFAIPECVRVIAGPDGARFAKDALEVFLASTYALSPASDRVGARLDGPPVLREGPDVGKSAPMVAGAIQVPSSGLPIVLGPDHPTTGGYPVIAVVAVVDRGGLFARRIGQRVRFVVCEG